MANANQAMPTTAKNPMIGLRVGARRRLTVKLSGRPPQLE